MIIFDSEVDFLKMYRLYKISSVRKVEKASKSNPSHNSYTCEETYKSLKGKNYYGNKRRNYSDYS
jgi:hypothetical protein